jgi:hypothetical protein
MAHKQDAVGILFKSIAHMWIDYYHIYEREGFSD